LFHYCKTNVYIAEAAVEEPKFTPFTGSGRRLDGKPSKDKDVLASSPAKRQANANNGVQPSIGSTSQSSSSRKTTGKLVFGSGGSRGDKVGIFKPCGNRPGSFCIFSKD
jgi:hypothetical protein